MHVPAAVRIKTRLIAVAAVLVGIVAGGTAWLATVRHAADLAESLQRSSDKAHVLAEQTSRTLQPVDLILREVASRLSSVGVQNTTSPAWNSRAMFDMLVEQRKGTPTAAVLYIIGADGQILNTSRGFAIALNNVSHRDYFKYLSTHDDHALLISQPMQLMFDGTWVVFMVRRINGSHGEFAGLVAAAMTLSYLEDFYKAVTPANGSVALLRQDGTILIRYPPAPHQAEFVMPPDSPWYTIRQQGGGAYRSPGYMDGMARLVAVHPLRDFPVIIDVTALESDVLAEWHHQVYQLVLYAMAVIAAVVFLLWAFGRQLMRLEQQNASLETSRVLFNAVLDNISQGLTFFDSDQRMMICNRRYAEIYKLSPEQTQIGTSLSNVLHSRASCGTLIDMPVSDYLARRNCLAMTKQPFDVTDELTDGRTVTMRFQPLPDGGWVTTHEDVTERRRAEADLAFIARHDALTSLPNRTLFHERLVHAVEQARHQQACALLCIDLDGFKVINDTMGHPAGDKLLCAVADRLRAIIRDTDTVARLGGDEFAVIQVGVKSSTNAAQLAERIVAELFRPFHIDGRQVGIGTSIGISMAPKDGASPEILLRSADVALYTAKAAGRGTYKLYVPELDEIVQQRRLLEMELRNALPAHFSLHYQPILALDTGSITGFEALLRWNHPVRGLMSPAEFIPIAENTGLIVQLGAWVLHTACKAAADWPASIEVAVNLSPVQFRDAQLTQTVQSALSASGLAPERLELEITETVLMQASEHSLAQLRELRALGVRVALDDFGTGYSSLSYLRSFPFDKIKIDQSFVRDIDTKQQSAVIVRAIIDLARNLGMTTVAEGVETVPQLRMLRDRACTQVQGFLFSRPRPVADVPALLSTLQMPLSIAYGDEWDADGEP